MEVIFDLAPELPQRVLIDKLRIQQVLINLIGNALKFTAQGQVWVQLSAQASEPSAGRSRVRFTIRDTGIGIREDQQNASSTALCRRKPPPHGVMAAPAWVW